MKSQELKEYTDRAHGLPVLGSLGWFSIAERRVDYVEFVKGLAMNKLDDFLPPVPRPSDVFKRCCTSNARRRVQSPIENVFENYLFEEVGKDDEHIWRRLVVKQVDMAGHTLDYTETFELRFERSTSNINASMLSAAYPLSDTIVKAVQSDFTLFTDTLTPNAVRAYVRDSLSRMHATVVRPSGGVYFTKVEHKERMESLEKLVDNLPGCSFHTLPLIDDRKQRDMLREAFEDESIGEIDKVLGDIGELLKEEKTITTDRYSAFAEQYNTLRVKVAEYSDLLDEAMGSTASRLEIMAETMTQLLLKVK